MPTVTNKKTRKTYPVTAEELKIIKGNRATRGLFTYQETIVPEEVVKMQKSMQDQAIPLQDPGNPLAVPGPDLKEEKKGSDKKQ